MDPIIGKIVYVVGYWIANFVIRVPHIKAREKVRIRANRNTLPDMTLFLAVSLGGFLVPLFYVFTPLLAFADYTIPRWVGLAGIAILIVANWLFWRAHRDLGQNWSPTLEIRDGHAIVTTGIYRRIRHPMYLSLWLLVLSQAMILPNYVAGFSGLLPFGILYFHRVKKEERMMMEEFGSEYERYLKKTGRLFPKWIRSVCLGLLVLASPFPAKAQSGFSEAEADGVRAFLRTTFTNGNAGMVIGILDRRGSSLFSAGKLDNGTDQEVNGDTIFEIGSVTKVFTSLLALEMARRGEVKLAEPVAKYLPERVRVPGYEGQEITLRHLATQDSGLPWNPDDLDRILLRDPRKPSLKEFKEACDAYTAEDLYAFLARHKLTNAPGTRFQYSNVGMALLGHAMALKAGETYESLVVQRIAGPLKMDSTRIILTPEQKTRLARGHWVDGTPSENVRFQVTASAGALLSSANDLLKFLSATLGFTRSELGPLMEEMQLIRHTGDQRFGSTAMPWLDEGLYQPPGSQLLAHGGGGFGYLAFIGFDKKQRRAVVVLSNQMAVNPSGVGWAILQGVPLSRENVTYFVREIVGVGMALDADQATGMVRITSVYPKSPAGQAGLTAGLLIQKINGVSVEGKSIQECLGLMGGPAGTKVRFEMLNLERKETNAVELTRQKFVTSTG